jgi:hypothetical protein
MIKKILFSFTIVLLVLLSALFGYENPEKINLTKQTIKYYAKKIGIVKEFKNIKKKITIVDNAVNIIEANSFSLEYSKVFDFSEKTAAVKINGSKNNLNINIYTQNGLKIDNNHTVELDLPLNFTTEQRGGVKGFFKINEEEFLYISNKIKECFYVSIYNLKRKKTLLKSKCLPTANISSIDSSVSPLLGKFIDFNGMGGASIKFNDLILLSIGVPETESASIRKLSQIDDSMFGKIITIRKDDLLNSNLDVVEYEIYSKGHRNPQGLVKYGNEIFSLEHGPQGGDELNRIQKGKNYGWPIVSYGTEYNDGQSYKMLNKKLYEEPVFTFIPSVATSSLKKCPSNLQKYYENNICLIGLSLKGSSLMVFLLNKKTLNLQSYEKIIIGERLRHFGTDFENNLFVDNDFFYISADVEGLYKLRFKDFR